MELPKNAKKVFKGILFDVYQWEQELFDGTKTTFEAIIRKPSVQIIPITKDNKIIVLEEEQPFRGKFLSLVGGQVERNETIIENVEKELKEETGCHSSNIIEFMKVSAGGKILWDTYYFIAKNCIKKYTPKPEAGEKIKIIELEFNEFIKFVLNENFRNKDFQNYIYKLKCEEKLDEFKNKLFY